MGGNLAWSGMGKYSFLAERIMLVGTITLALDGVASSNAAAAKASVDEKPRWGSLAVGHVMMRAGPGRNFPALWDYHRAQLPIIILQTYPNWRKIIDPDGATGWVQANLVSETRTAVVIGDARVLRQLPKADAPIIWRVEPGVVGKITACANGWCRLDVRGARATIRAGYIETSSLWGAG